MLKVNLLRPLFFNIFFMERKFIFLIFWLKYTSCIQKIMIFYFVKIDN
ncbi:hypothetical protein NAL19_1745 [Pectobacterium sp. F1-1]|nr:hypothetical protein NAL19_1745 [Pectobacterium sp. F1-1]